MSESATAITPTSPSATSQPNSSNGCNEQSAPASNPHLEKAVRAIVDEYLSTAWNMLKWMLGGITAVVGFFGINDAVTLSNIHSTAANMEAKATNLDAKLMKIEEEFKERSNEELERITKDIDAKRKELNSLSKEIDSLKGIDTLLKDNSDKIHSAIITYVTAELQNKDSVFGKQLRDSTTELIQQDMKDALTWVSANGDELKDLSDLIEIKRVKPQDLPAISVLKIKGALHVDNATSVGYKLFVNDKGYFRFGTNDKADFVNYSTFPSP